jgi:hypothetical protein
VDGLLQLLPVGDVEIEKKLAPPSVPRNTPTKPFELAAIDIPLLE